MLQRPASAAFLLLLLPCMVCAKDDVSHARHRDLLADAEGRTSFLSQPYPSVTVGGFTQIRYDLNSRDNVMVDDGATLGFSVRRTKIILRGDINEQIGYFVQTNFTAAGAANLDDAFGTFKFDNRMILKVGQFRMPFLREELVLETRQLAADRSATNFVFNQGRSQGVQLSQADEKWRWFAAFSDGFNAANTDFNSPNEAEYAVTARAECLIMGSEWRRFDDFTSFMDQDMAVMGGIAVHFQSDGRDAAGLAVSGMASATADISVEGDGWNAFGAVIWRHIDPQGTGPDFAEFGFVMQGGIFLTRTWEAFARLDIVFPDDDRGMMSKEFTTITCGANHYLVEGSHAAKITFDVQYFGQEQSRSIVPANTALGLLPHNDEPQWNFRGQLQLVY